MFFVNRGRLIRRIGLIMLGAAIASFGIHSIHHRTGITEGGVLGAMLLLNHWFRLPASILTPVLDVACYIPAALVLGFGFIRWSVFSTLCVAGFFRLWESLPPLLPDLSAHPLLAALLGALFVGVGVGLIIRQGGSSGGDDALALTISKLTGWNLARFYLLTDLTVLLLSLTYIPFLRIFFSLITVTLSSKLIDVIHGIGRKSKTEGE
jgi:uncharacterized membrane-anchored protein YitT (DUF2179 family)